MIGRVKMIARERERERERESRNKESMVIGKGQRVTTGTHEYTH